LKIPASRSSCSVPLDLVVCRGPEDQNLEECRGILSTAVEEQHAVPALKRYRIRVAIEERHRQLKRFWTWPTSPPRASR